MKTEEFILKHEYELNNKQFEAVMTKAINELTVSQRVSLINLFASVSAQFAIPKNYFRDKRTLKAIQIPYGVTSIGEGAFFYCSSLTSITIPESVTSIGEWAFGSCHGLTSVTIPNSVTSIGYCAFLDCSSLTSVIVPDTVTSIGSFAFSECTGLRNIVIPNSVTSIGQGAFYRCTSSLTIYCEAESQPSGWHEAWAGENCKVIWGHK